MIFLKEDTAVDVKVGPFVDDADGFTLMTGLTITQPDVLLSKNGGTLTQKNAAQTLSHDANGFYTVNLDTTDTSTPGSLVLSINESGALPVWLHCMVMPANVWDSLFGADKLQVDVTEIAANAITATAINSGAITSAKFAAGAIDATAVADGAIDAGAVAAGAANKIADHTLRRTYANARASSDGDTFSFRSLMGAVAKLVNKWSISGSTVTYTHEDDTTSAGTQTLTSSASAEPITGLDT
jgi:hypothetical protein